jgi:hypothetical protein
VASRTFEARHLAAAFLFLLGGAAIWSATNGTSPGDVRLLPCLVQSTVHVPCPGCGMTRACVALARGELAQAWSLHPFAYLLVPLSLLVACWPTRTRGAWLRAPSGLRATVSALAICACLGLWLSRLLGAG